MTCKGWRVMKAQTEGEGRRTRPFSFFSSSLSALLDAMCVVCPRDSSAATPHVCLGRKEGKPLLFSSLSPFHKTASHWLPDAVAMVFWCSGNWQGEKSVGCCHLYREGCNYLLSFHFSFLLWPSSPLYCCLWVVKNSPRQTF